MASETVIQLKHPVSYPPMVVDNHSIQGTPLITSCQGNQRYAPASQLAQSLLADVLTYNTNIQTSNKYCIRHEPGGPSGQRLSPVPVT